MEKLIISKFIKNYDNVFDPSVRKRYGTVLAVVGIICNLILFSVKITIGIMIKSVSVMADAFNNLSDGGSNIVMLIGFKMSSKPADKEHPYGHGRIEYLMSLIIAVIIILMAYELFRASVLKIISPTPVEAGIATFIALIAGGLIKLWLAGFYKSTAKKIESQTLKAAAFDSLSDAFATAVIIISLIADKAFGIAVDGYAGVIVALFIFIGGVKLCKEAIDLIIGPPVEHELSDKIKAMALENKEVKGVHDLVVHNYGSGSLMATLDAEMSSNLTLMEAHSIIDKIENNVKKELGIRLVLHIDPIIIGDPKIDEIAAYIIKIINETDDGIEMHSFELTGVFAEFELDLPHSYTGDKERELTDKVMRKLAKEFPDITFKINIDKSFTKSN